MNRRTARPAADTALVHRIASVLLRYPDEDLFAQLADVAAAIRALTDADDRARLSGVVRHLHEQTQTDAGPAYVETFDHTPRRCLYLTYYRYGDTRARGMALLALKHTYRQAGHPPPESELPDFLPLVLEFASVAPEPGRRVLQQCQAGLELLRQALREREDAYAPVLDAVCGRLPTLRGHTRDLLRRLAAEGPPREEVGLEPFAPPEYLTSSLNSPVPASGTATPSGGTR